MRTIWVPIAKTSLSLSRSSEKSPVKCLVSMWPTPPCVTVNDPPLAILPALAAKAHLSKISKSSKLSHPHSRTKRASQRIYPFRTPYAMLLHCTQCVIQPMKYFLRSAILPSRALLLDLGRFQRRSQRSLEEDIQAATAGQCSHDTRACYTLSAHHA